MTGFSVLLRKELLEQWRTLRLPVVAAVFLLNGIISPLLARFTPELVEALGGDALFVEDRVPGRRIERGGEPAVATRLGLPLGTEPAVVAAHRFTQLDHHALVLVEALTEPGIEEVPVHRRRRARMTVGRDHRVPVHRDPPEVVFESHIRITPGARYGPER